ncbi:hypothetical protein EVAR_39678_1 [Eumeta japonica]|uniref:Uncharacterized protein n=1 Tax=Eumeta variegata TaxID=151549 RepID=A0A4C1Z7V5_EUMVA|nr:hypothetical protein EVAR_39678_1 [Eumeta japonica]
MASKGGRSRLRRRKRRAAAAAGGQRGRDCGTSATAAQHLYERCMRPASHAALVILCASTITLFPAFASYFLSKRQEYFCFIPRRKETTRRLSRHAAARAGGGGAVYKQRLVNANTDRFPEVNGETGESCALCTDAARNMSVHSKGKSSGHLAVTAVTRRISS